MPNAKTLSDVMLKDAQLLRSNEQSTLRGATCSGNVGMLFVTCNRWLARVGRSYVMDLYATHLSTLSHAS
jgi:hypothetical protein